MAYCYNPMLTQGELTINKQSPFAAAAASGRH